MGKFDLKQLLSSSSLNPSERDAKDVQKPRAVLKVISLNVNNLIPSAGNFYSVENISELKDSIEMFGVKQNLTVKPLKNGMYEVISGHRRRLACLALVAEGKTEFEYVPCAVESERDEIKERLLLIMTNSTTRQLTDWEKTQQAEEMRKLFEELRKREKLPGRTRELVAEALNTSSTQIARMDAISKNLAPEFKEEFKKQRVGLSTAYELSGLPEEEQKEAYQEYKQKGGLSLNEVKSKKKVLKQQPDLPLVLAQVAQVKKPIPGETQCIDSCVCPYCGHKFDGGPATNFSTACKRVTCPNCEKTMKVFQSIQYICKPQESDD